MSEGREASGDEPQAAPSAVADPQIEHADADAEWTRQRIRQLPPEVGVVLVGVGVIGVILPGPLGAPLILAGGLVLIPRVFCRLEAWLHRRFPKSHRVGLNYVDRFIDDYERRYPGHCDRSEAAPTCPAPSGDPPG